MSTSKKRRKAREWMQNELEVRKKETAEARNQGEYVGRRQGERAMAEEILRLSPTITEEFTDDRGHHVRSIPKFPQPPEQRVPPVVKVPMPYRRQMISPFMIEQYRGLPGSLNDHIERHTIVSFRPIEMAFNYRFENGSTELRWFNWEPDRGNEANETYTKAMYSGMGKLGAALGIIRLIRSYGTMMSVEAHRAELLLKEAFDELSAKLGKFAPDAYVPTVGEVRENLYAGGYPFPVPGRT